MGTRESAAKADSKRAPKPLTINLGESFTQEDLLAAITRILKSLQVAHKGCNKVTISIDQEIPGKGPAPLPGPGPTPGPQGTT